jgi:hypothetical protein
MQIVFTSWWPAWLLAAVPIVLLLTAGRPSSSSRRRVRIASGLRIAAYCLIVGALMGPRLELRMHEISVVYAIDVSNSVSAQFVRGALDWIQDANRRYRPAQARYVVFADRPKLIDELTAIPAVSVSSGATRTTDSEAIDQSATDLEQALNAARFGFEPGFAKRLVLITDGNETEGDVWRVIPALRAEHIRVFSLPAVPARESYARIDQLELPESVRQEEPVSLQVRIAARDTNPARVDVAVGGEAAGSRTVSLSQGVNRLSFQLRFKHTGETTVVVRLALDKGGTPAVDTYTQSVWVKPRPRVLYVESDRSAAHYLASALKLQGIDVTTVDPERLSEPSVLRDEDAVIVSDIPADHIDAAGIRNVSTFVRDRGGALLFAAGENTYGKTGYTKGEMERLLPVRFEGRRKRKDLDLVLLIDRSYSMRGRKLEMAKSAALATLDLLEEQHRLAVIAFDSRPHEVVPLLPVGSKRRAEDLISSMSASGQTNIYHALSEAYRVLAGSNAKTKHVILLSDGDTAPPPAAANTERMSDSESAWETMRRSRRDSVGRPLLRDEAGEAAPTGGSFADIVADMTAANITLSTVALGEKPNLELMRSLAEWGEGKSYVAARDIDIPGLFVAEARRLLGESLVEESFRPTAKVGSEALSGIDFSSGPPLKGYVVARAKRFSGVLLEAKHDQPLLLETRYGLGKSIAFLSDVKNRWAAEWVSWPGYGRFWAQLVRDAVRDRSNPGLTFRVSRRGREALVELSALDPEGRYRNQLAPLVQVITPDGRSAVQVLRQVAPGRYAVRMPLQPSSTAPYRFALMSTHGLPRTELALTGSRSLYYAGTDEYRALPPNLAMLAALSEQTGGKLAPAPAEIFARSADAGIVATPLWPYLAALALLLFLADIAVRRLPWPLRGKTASTKPAGTNQQPLDLRQ